MRRFWNEVAVVALVEGFTIHLDRRPLRLPEGEELRLPGAALAQAVAEEWRGLGQEFSYEDVKLTRIIGTGTSRIAPAPEPSIAALARYGESDLLCYRASTPVALARRQQERWQPWLDWAARVLDAPLAITDGVMPCPQLAASLAALRAALAREGAIRLAALGVLVPALGSLVLGLAVAAGALDGAQAQELAELDALFQEEIWGQDEASTARRTHVAGEIAAAARILALTHHAEGTPS